MSTVIHLLFDTAKNAKQCKEHFEDDYDMYVSWCSQFKRTTEGQRCWLVPVSKSVYEE